MVVGTVVTGGGAIGNEGGAFAGGGGSTIVKFDLCGH